MALAGWTFQRFTQRALMILVTRQRAQLPASPAANPPPLKHTVLRTVLLWRRKACVGFSQRYFQQTHYYENWSGWLRVIPGTDNCSCKDFLQICISLVYQYLSLCHAFVAVDQPTYRKAFCPGLKGCISEAVWFNVSLWSMAGLWLTFAGIYPLTDRLPIGVLLCILCSTSFLQIYHFVFQPESARHSFTHAAAWAYMSETLWVRLCKMFKPGHGGRKKLNTLQIP